MRALSQTFGTDINRSATIYGDVRLVNVRPLHAFHYDTAVIGGGLTGLHTALELAERGQRVVLFEAGKIGAGPSGRSGGQLWPGYDVMFSDMQAQQGPNLATSAWHYVHEGLAKVHQRLNAHPRKCDFKPGVALMAMNAADDQWCRDEAAALTSAGFSFARYVSGQTIKDKLFNTTAFTGGILYQGDDFKAQYGHVNPALYVQTLANLASKLGVTLVEDAPVNAIRKLGQFHAVNAGPRQVIADHVVMATGADMTRPDGVNYKVLPREFIKAQTMILATEPMSRELAKQIAPGDACGCDTRSIGMNYFRMADEPDGSGRVRLAFGGADALMQLRALHAFEAGKIERDMHKVFPQLKQHDIKLERVWGGYCDISPSALPKINQVAAGFYAISGLSGQGNVLTQVLGQAVAEKIVDGASDRFDTIAALTADRKPFPRSEALALAQMAYDVYAKEKIEAVSGAVKRSLGMRGPNAA